MALASNARLTVIFSLSFKYLEQSNDEFGVEQVNGFTVPRIFALQFDLVQYVLDADVYHDR